jgi:Fe-S cluster assembly iron-binding protein IscA
MLAMTRSAAAAVEAIVTQPEVPDGAVVRIVARDSSDNGSEAVDEVELALVDHPLASDLVVEEARISVEPRSLPFLEDKVLDAEFADGGGVEFRLFSQGSGSG